MTKTIKDPATGAVYINPTEEQLTEKLGAEAADALLLGDAKAIAAKMIDDYHAKMMRDLTGNATIEERDTWQAKRNAAAALVAGSADEHQTAMITLEATEREITPEALAGLILEKNAAFHVLIGRAAGIRTKAKMAVGTAKSPEEIATVIAACKAAADAAIAEFTAAKTEE